MRIEQIEQTKYLRDLHRKITKHFDIEELKVIAFYVAVDWDDLSGDAKPVKIQSLIFYLNHRGELKGLIKVLQEERPKVVWPEVPDEEQQIEDQKSLIPPIDYAGYISRILTMLANKQLDLTPENKDNRSKATTFTHRALWSVNAEQKAEIICFLHENKLITKPEAIIDLNGANLRNVDLQSVDLREIILDGANLTTADFRKADLTNASLRKTNLKGVDFKEANLTSTDFSKTNLKDTIWANLFFWKNNFKKSVVRDTDLSGLRQREFHIDLMGIDFAGSNLSEVYFESVNLSGANLERVDFSDAWLHRVDFSNAHLINANFTNSKIEGCHFDNANLELANLDKAEFNNTMFRKAKLKNAILNDTKLIGVDFEDAEITVAQLLTATALQRVVTPDKTHISGSDSDLQRSGELSLESWLITQGIDQVEARKAQARLVPPVTTTHGRDGRPPRY